MSLSSLNIAGIELSIVAWLDYSQTIEPIGASSTRRMGNGDLAKMTRWRKWRISISASGWIPPAINAIDYDAPFVVALPAPITLATGEPLPDGLTARGAPWDEVVITDQADNSARLVFIQATVSAEPPSQRHGNNATPSWELVMETI